jgi:hypothetical protein
MQRKHTYIKYAIGAMNAVFILTLIFFGAQKSKALPSYARQTGMACSSCHIAFPQLNPFGRLFKLNGYTLNTSDVIESKQEDSTGSTTYLSLLKIPPISGMLQTSFTHLNKPAPNTANNSIAFPQQLSLFLAGEITPRLGLFMQITYDDQSKAFGWDNTELRYANNTTIGNSDLIYGFTLNNNPTVQDVWNTTPAWGFPYASSSFAPTPAASPFIAGGLGGQSLGLGAYALWDGLIYGEICFYGSELQGVVHPYSSTDTTVVGLVKGVAPYWRFALQKQFSSQYISVGTFGMIANTIPAGISGTANKLTDIGADLQFETGIGSGSDMLSVYASFIHENMNLDATFQGGGSQNQTNSLNQININASYYFMKCLNLSLGYFSTSGSADSVLYSPAQGYYGNIPNSDGLIAEFGYIPWLNTRFSLQYVLYNKFNGGTTNYDGAGRNASDNNTIYLLTWIMF